MMNNKRLFIFLIIALLLLLIPFIAVQYTDEVRWDLMDYIIGGILLFILAVIMEIVLRKTTKTNLRIIIISTLLILFVLTWIELAVGIFGK